jgi:hypothetical protein
MSCKKFKLISYYLHPQNSTKVDNGSSLCPIRIEGAIEIEDTDLKYQISQELIENQSANGKCLSLSNQSLTSCSHCAQSEASDFQTK